MTEASATGGPPPQATRIDPRDRLIVALDVSTADEARNLVCALDDSVQFYKIGLQLFMAEGYFELLGWLREKGKKVFVDLKFFDIPPTVALAVEQLAKHDVQFATVHGNDRILEAAVGKKRGLQILAVTVLTSLDQNDLDDLGFQCAPEELVLSRARRAIALGCDGIVSSGLELPTLRRDLGGKFIVVTPGIRPVRNDVDADDQKRVVTPTQALRDGADYIVVGRPIRDAADPKGAAMAIQREIAGVFDAW
jgi:orotidine-5'-phosphate decarboxylase